MQFLYLLGFSDLVMFLPVQYHAFLNV